MGERPPLKPSADWLQGEACPSESEMRFGLPKLPLSYPLLKFCSIYGITGDEEVIRAVYPERLASGTALCHRYPAVDGWSRWHAALPTAERSVIQMQCKASLHVGKRYSRRHNVRDYNAAEWNKDGHIDADRSTQNVVLTDKSLRKFFDEIFGEAIEEANEKNRKKHPERCTTVAQYYSKYCSHAQEAIVQIGDGTTYQAIVAKYGREKADNFYKTALENTFKKFKEENPSLKVFGAYIHMDETTPHLHLDFLPVAESKRGQQIKVSMDGAMQEIGFARSKSDKFGENPYQRWLKDRRADFENFYQQQADKLLGKDVLEILPSEKSTRPHLETWQWKQQRLEAELTDLTQQKNSLQSDVKQAKKTQSEIQQDTEKLKREAEQAKAEKLMTIQIPPRPTLPEKPEKPKEPWYGSKADEKQYKKDLKEYEKQLKQWERDVPRIQQAQDQWDSDYSLLTMVQDTHEKQAQTAREQAQRADAITQASKTLRQERATIPQQVEAAVQDRLRKAEQFTEMMKVSQAWKDRYQQAFGKPYIDTREEQSKDASENVKAEHDAGLWEYGD